MKKEQVICDHCNADITYTTNCMAYRLVLQAESTPKQPGLSAVTAMHISPDIPYTMHFCSVRCLRKLINDKYGY